MKRYTVVARPDVESETLANQLRKVLNDCNHIEDIEHPEIVFVIGGDGTFIYAVHQYINQLQEILFYGIHTGTLGFYTDYKDTEMDAFTKAYLQNETQEIQYPLLEVHTENETYYALNEMRIENVVRTQEMNVYFNQQLFETYRGTGLCLSTQLGSTAYNRSLGGAIIQEGLDLIELTEIAGIHHQKYRSLSSPIVLKNDLHIQFEAEDYSGAILGIDSNVYSLDQEQLVSVHISQDHHVRMLRGKEVSYFKRLQSLFL